MESTNNFYLPERGAKQVTSQGLRVNLRENINYPAYAYHTWIIQKHDWHVLSVMSMDESDADAPSSSR